MLRAYLVPNSLSAQFDPKSSIPNLLPIADGLTDVKLSIQKILHNNKVLLTHIDTTRGYYKASWELYLPLLDTLRVKSLPAALKINELLLEEGLSGNRYLFNPAVVNELKKIYLQRSRIRNLFEGIVGPNMPWMNRWLWYTKGIPKLNPFYRDPQPLLTETDNLLTIAKERLKLLDISLKNDLGLSDINSFAELKSEHTLLMNGVSGLETLKKNLTKEKSLYDRWLNSLTFTSEVLNDMTLYVSDEKTIRWMHHFDAANQYKSLNIEKTLPSQVSDRDEVIALIYNAPDSLKLVLNATDSTIVPRPQLAQSLAPFEQSLLASLGGVDAMTTLFGRLFPIVNPGSSQVPPVTLSASVGNLSRIKADEDRLRQGAEMRDSSSPDSEIIAEAKNLLAQGFTELAFRKLGRKLILGQFEKANISDSDTKNIINGLRYGFATTISCATSTTSTSANEACLFVKDLFAKLDKEDSLTFVSLIYDLFAVKDTVVYKKLIQNYEVTYQELKWLLDQTPIPPQILAVKGQTNKAKPFHTEVHNVEEALHKIGSTAVKYALRVKGKTDPPVISQTYTKYARTYFWPAVGAVYIPGSRNASLFDEKTGQFSTSTNVDNFEVIAGVKIYPFGANISRDLKTVQRTKWNDWRGNGFVTSRLFGFAGLGMRHKFLKNYVVGAGFDIIPGLSVQGGRNFLFQKRYELENGRVKNEFERPIGNWYYGISLDPTIVPQIINIFR